MLSVLLRSLHIAPGLVFIIVYAGYAAWASLTMINGYTREITGWKHPGRPSRMHKVLYQLHTGQKISGRSTYGDDNRKLRNTAGGSSRATPEGMTVYFHPWKRKHRALRNNIIVAVWLSIVSGMAIDPRATVQGVTALVMFTAASVAVIIVRARRQRHILQLPVTRPALSQSGKAKNVLRHDKLTEGSKPVLLESSRPVLESGVPVSTIATLLADQMGCSTEEAMRRLRIEPDRGQMSLPDHYAAMAKSRDGVEEIIRSHTDGKVTFTWKTTTNPRVITWLPVVEHRLPDIVMFRDYLAQAESLGPRETGAGVRADRSVYVQSHNGDLPWWCRFMGSGTGKSMSFLVKAAQIAHKDPRAEIYCFDTKQVSFEALHGIPGVHVFDNPVTGMNEIWDGFYSISSIMTGRYKAVREKRSRLSDFPDIWVFVDEGNHLGGRLKNYWTKTLGESSATPSIWAEAVAPLLQQGRQANIFGEWMFQDVTDRAMGGQSLKFAFGAFVAAGFQPNQFTRTVGPPSEECLEGPGKMLICQGNRRTWIQGFMDEEQFLHDYALENRKGLVAA